MLVYIGLGANLGEARQTLELAIEDLRTIPQIQVLDRSHFYSSAPIDSDGNDYVNAVVLLYTSLTADDLLRVLQHIEHHFGRQRPYHNAPRTLDLDILLYGDLQCQTDFLTLPHPRMHQRAFVLLPLLELDADIYIPGLGTAQSFVAEVADQVLHRME